MRRGCQAVKTEVTTSKIYERQKLHLQKENISRPKYDLTLPLSLDTLTQVESIRFQLIEKMIEIQKIFFEKIIIQSYEDLIRRVSIL